MRCRRETSKLGAIQRQPRGELGDDVLAPPSAVACGEVGQGKVVRVNKLIWLKQPIQRAEDETTGRRSTRRIYVCRTTVGSNTSP